MPSGTRNVMWDRLFRLSAESGMSLQGQIRQTLVSAILDGQLPPDVPLPSSRQLAAELGVARNTVVLAYQELVDEGYLIPRQRSGYFVSDDQGAWKDVYERRLAAAKHPARAPLRAAE